MSTKLCVLLVSVVCVACGGTDSAESARATELHVVISGNESAFSHQDSFAGQTARNVTAGVRSLRLIDDTGQAWTLFDRAPSSITVGYAAGARTELVSVAPADVRAGHYVKARLVQDWSRFDVDATLHDTSGASAGTLTDFQITTDGANVNGKTYTGGHYEQHFSAPTGDHDYDGEVPIPDHSQTAGADAVVEQGEWAVYFPLDLQLAAGARGELHIDVNLDHAFRWTDESLPGYATGSYDFAPPLYEPVEQFGGNRFDVTLSGS